MSTAVRVISYILHFPVFSCQNNTRANARSVSFRISLRWRIYIINPVLIKPNYLLILLPTQHRHSFFRNLPPFIHLVIRVIFKFQRIYIFFSQQFQYTAVRPLFRLQVLNKATVIPARDYLLVQKRQIQSVILTASPNMYRHIPSSPEEEATAYDLFAHWGVGAGTSIQAAAIFDEWRWGGPGTETRDHSEMSEGKEFFRTTNGFMSTWRFYIESNSKNYLSTISSQSISLLNDHFDHDIALEVRFEYSSFFFYFIHL